MPRFAITYDLEKSAMERAGYTPSQINNDVYGTGGEIQKALDACGFINHIEGSVHHTNMLSDDDALTLIFDLQREFQTKAPTFCKYVKSIHLFKMDGTSNLTAKIKAVPCAVPPIISPIGIPAAAPAVVKGFSGV